MTWLKRVSKINEDVISKKAKVARLVKKAVTARRGHNHEVEIERGKTNSFFPNVGILESFHEKN